VETNLNAQPVKRGNATTPAAVTAEAALLLRGRELKPHSFHLAASALALLALTVLGGCNDRAASSVKPPTLVRTETVRLQDRQSSVVLTGAVQARIQTDLSFRVSGRVITRLVDVGAHVHAGDLLARINPAEQQADLDAATASLAAAKSQVRVAASTFERQKTLLAEGFTTQAAFDQAQEGLRTADGSLESAKAQLGRSKEATGDTELRASAT
jgi:multidrug efflux pump subunit AcrA (membrane-fusion protein)